MSETAPRMRELNRLISLGLGDANFSDHVRAFQTLHCVTCHRSFLRRLGEIDPEQPQYCRPWCRALATWSKRGYSHKPGWQPPEVRRQIYLEETGRAAPATSAPGNAAARGAGA